MQHLNSASFFRRVTNTHRLCSNLFRKDDQPFLCERPFLCFKTNVPLVLVYHQYATQSGISHWLKKIVGIGILSKSVSRSVGFKLYESIDANVNHDIFFKGLNMEDSFHSWFIIRGVHVWMLMVRLMNEGEKGRLVRNALVEAMWQDVDFKSKQLGDTPTSVRRKQIQMLVDEFQASLFSYDEGLQSSDQVLAGAIWRNVLLQQDFDPRKLEALVDYIRSNIARFDKTNYDTIFIECKVEWSQICL